MGLVCPAPLLPLLHGPGQVALLFGGRRSISSCLQETLQDMVNLRKGLPQGCGLRKLHIRDVLPGGVQPCAALRKSETWSTANVMQELMRGVNHLGPICRAFLLVQPSLTLQRKSRNGWKRGGLHSCLQQPEGRWVPECHDRCSQSSELKLLRWKRRTQPKQ